MSEYWGGNSRLLKAELYALFRAGKHEQEAGIKSFYDFIWVRGVECVLPLSAETQENPVT